MDALLDSATILPCNKRDVITKTYVKAVKGYKKVCKNSNQGRIVRFGHVLNLQQKWTSLLLYSATFLSCNKRDVITQTYIKKDG